MTRNRKGRNFLPLSPNQLGGALEVLWLLHSTCVVAAARMPSVFYGSHSKTLLRTPELLAYHAELLSKLSSLAVVLSFSFDPLNGLLAHGRNPKVPLIVVIFSQFVPPLVASFRR